MKVKDAIEKLQGFDPEVELTTLNAQTGEQDPLQGFAGLGATQIEVLYAQDHYLDELLSIYSNRRIPVVL